MTGAKEDIIDRYLDAVAAQLPADERADIIAELKDLILSRVEAKEEALGRPLSEDEKEAILKEIGHPLVVAARYRKGPDSLIGPELFPYWLYGVKAGLLILGALAVIGLVIRLAGGSADFGQDIAQSVHGFFGAGLGLIGALTLAGAIMEHYAIRPKWMTEWRGKDLGAFGLSDPGQWGAAVQGRSPIRPAMRPARWFAGRSDMRWPGGEAVFGVIAMLVFIAWWTGAWRLTGVAEIDIGAGTAHVTPGPVWRANFAPILLLAIVQLWIEIVRLFRPQWRRLIALAQTAASAVGLAIAWVVFNAGHWFTLTQDGRTARVAGGPAMLDFDRLGAIDRISNDLAGSAELFSLILSWVMVAVMISLALNTLRHLWAAARGRD